MIIVERFDVKQRTPAGDASMIEPGPTTNTQLTVLHAKEAADGVLRQVEAVPDEIADPVAQGHGIERTYTYDEQHLWPGIPKIGF